VVVVFENHAGSSVLGSGSAPYFDSLAAAGANFRNSFAVTHPSEPNYLDLFSGSDHGITDDSCPHTINAPNLGSELFGRGRSFAGYSEDLPSPGSAACSGPAASGPSDSGYARKHNPWVNFPNVPAAANLPMSSFPSDYARLPTVSFVVPNLCHDMHDCSVGTGDAWLRQSLGSYAAWAQSHDSLLIVTFDEDDGDTGNSIATVFYGGPVRPGRYTERIDHFSVLRTLADMYGLGYAGAAAAAHPITDVWR
jgi:hypothetical protein